MNRLFKTLLALTTLLFSSVSMATVEKSSSLHNTFSFIAGKEIITLLLIVIGIAVIAHAFNKIQTKTLKNMILGTAAIIGAHIFIF